MKQFTMNLRSKQFIFTFRALIYLPVKTMQFYIFVVHLPHRVKRTFQIASPYYFIWLLISEVSIYYIATRLIYTNEFIIVILGVIHGFCIALRMNVIYMPAIKVTIDYSATYLIKKSTAVHIVYHQRIFKNI
jgi:hypothetical protein